MVAYLLIFLVLAALAAALIYFGFWDAASQHLFSPDGYMGLADTFVIDLSSMVILLFAQILLGFVIFESVATRRAWRDARRARRKFIDELSNHYTKEIKLRTNTAGPLPERDSRIHDRRYDDMQRILFRWSQFLSAEEETKILEIDGFFEQLIYDQNPVVAAEIANRMKTLHFKMGISRPVRREFAANFGALMKKFIAARIDSESPLLEN